MQPGGLNGYALFLALAHHLPDVVVVVFDQDHRHTLVEGASTIVFGVDQAQLRGATAIESLPGSIAEALTPLYQQTLAGMSQTHEIAHEGQLYQIDCVPLVVQNSQPMQGMAIIHNITSRKHAEDEQIRLIQELLEGRNRESLVVLASGIAHVFNNMLAVMMGYAELALASLPVDSSAHDDIVPIIKTAKRAAGLTSQILTYTGRQKIAQQIIDLNLVVETLPGLFGQIMPPLAALNLDLEEHLPPIRGDSMAIQQMLSQIVTNAAEAIGDSQGTITISTAMRTLSAQDLRQMDVSAIAVPGPCIELSIRDTGCGMDVATHQRIFEPFFTTKFTGRGLGLPAALGTVRSHHAAIRVESQVQIGTVVSIYFPTITRDQPIQHQADGLEKD